MVGRGHHRKSTKVHRRFLFALITDGLEVAGAVTLGQKRGDALKQLAKLAVFAHILRRFERRVGHVHAEEIPLRRGEGLAHILEPERGAA